MCTIYVEPHWVCTFLEVLPRQQIRSVWALAQPSLFLRRGTGFSYQEISGLFVPAADRMNVILKPAWTHPAREKVKAIRELFSRSVDCEPVLYERGGA
jgi:hypothetical protein